MANKQVRPQNKRTKKFVKGDTVIAISGNDKGRKGTILAVHGDKAVVEGLNVRLKFVKSPDSKEKRQEPTKREMPIHISNLQPCTSDGVPIKLKVRVTPEGARQMVYKSENGAEVVHRTLKS